MTLNSTLVMRRGRSHLRLVKRLEGFTSGARLDWLHPSHGPFPDFAGIFEDKESGDRFESLVWEDRNSWIAAVQGNDLYHNGFPRSYRWWTNGKDFRKISCSPDRGSVYDIELKGAETAKEIASASAYVLILTELNVRG